MIVVKLQCARAHRHVQIARFTRCVPHYKSSRRCNILRLLFGHRICQKIGGRVPFSFRILKFLSSSLDRISTIGIGVVTAPYKAKLVAEMARATRTARGDAPFCACFKEKRRIEVGTLVRIADCLLQAATLSSRSSHHLLRTEVRAASIGQTV